MWQRFTRPLYVCLSRFGAFRVMPHLRSAAIASIALVVASILSVSAPADMAAADAGVGVERCTHVIGKGLLCITPETVGAGTVTIRVDFTASIMSADCRHTLFVSLRRAALRESRETAPVTMNSCDGRSSFDYTFKDVLPIDVLCGGVIFGDPAFPSSEAEMCTSGEGVVIAP